MSVIQLWLEQITKLGLILIMVVSLNACSGLPGLPDANWREEALLHDGSKIFVDRSVARGGRHELGQKPSFKWQKLKFTIPVTGESVTWEDNYSEDIGTSSFLPMLLDVHQGAAYLVANTMGCLSYNKWGRPNPPYVAFKYESKEWKRIPLQELPVEIKRPNLIQSEPDAKARSIRERPVSAKAIQEIIARYPQPYYRTILREALANGNGCQISTTMTGQPIAPVVNGQILYYNWWPLAKDWLKSNYGGSK